MCYGCLRARVKTCNTCPQCQQEVGEFVKLLGRGEVDTYKGLLMVRSACIDIEYGMFVWIRLRCQQQSSRSVRTTTQV